MSGRGRRAQGRDNPLEFVQQWRERSRRELVTLTDGRMVTQEEHLQSLDTDRREELEQLRREAEYLMYIGGLPEEDFLLLRQQGMLGDRRNTTPEDLEARRQQLRTTNLPAVNQPGATNQHTATQPATNQHTPTQPATNQHIATQPAANQHAATQQAPVTRMQLRPRQTSQQTSTRESGQSGRESGRHRGLSGLRGAAARRRNNRPASASGTSRPSNNTSDTGNDASEEASASSTAVTTAGSRRGRGRRRRPNSATVSGTTQSGRTTARTPRPTTASAGRRSSSQPSRGAGSVNRPRRRLTGRRRVRPREGSGGTAFQQQLDMLAYQLFLRSFLEEEDALNGSDSDSSDFSDSWDEDYDSWEDFLEDELSDDESSDSWDGFLEVMGMFSPRDAEMFGDVEVEEDEAPRGLTKDEIAQLPCRKFTRADAQRLAAEGNETSCTICMVEYKTGNKLRRMPCAHEFHSKCVDRWLKQNGSCPVCRQQVEISVNPQTAEGQQTTREV
ncbi:RLIM [Branchiostoma lanceolatum]|uniref:RLIM protein n=2 Tax=Branchiostoma lanceolatum TaxID=7740 RepID=A0A8J9V629_BRALA|nr:RLIM [Branchiostoma lanceolatum]